MCSPVIRGQIASHGRIGEHDCVSQILLQFSLMPRRALLAPGSQAPLRGPRSPFLCRILVRLSVMLLLFLKWEAEAKAPLL